MLGPFSTLTSRHIIVFNIQAVVWWTAHWHACLIELNSLTCLHAPILTSTIFSRICCRYSSPVAWNARCCKGGWRPAAWFTALLWYMSMQVMLLGGDCRSMSSRLSASEKTPSRRPTSSTNGPKPRPLRTLFFNKFQKFYLVDFLTVYWPSARKEQPKS